MDHSLVMVKGQLNEFMSHAVYGTQGGWVMVESSDKTWSTGGGNGKPLQYSCCKNSMNSMNRQNDMTPEDDALRSEGVQYATGKEHIMNSN